MMKCLECSYTTTDNDKKYCPYDGSELVESDTPTEDQESFKYNEEYEDDN